MARAISGRPYAVVTLHVITDRSGTGRNGGLDHQDRRANAPITPKAVGHSQGRTTTASKADEVSTGTMYQKSEDRSQKPESKTESAPCAGRMPSVLIPDF